MFATKRVVPVEQLLIFIHGVVTLTIPQLKLPEAKKAEGTLSANSKPQLATTSEAGLVRAQCKRVVLKYMINYPLKNEIQRHLEFFLAQLEYENEIG